MHAGTALATCVRARASSRSPRPRAPPAPCLGLAWQGGLRGEECVRDARGSAPDAARDPARRHGARRRAGTARSTRPARSRSVGMREGVVPTPRRAGGRAGAPRGGGAARRIPHTLSALPAAARALVLFLPVRRFFSGRSSARRSTSTSWRRSAARSGRSGARASGRGASTRHSWSCRRQRPCRRSSRGLRRGRCPARPEPVKDRFRLPELPFRCTLRF